MDNLNTHRAAALYERVPAAEARRIANKIVWCNTPEQSRWLNITEHKPSALKR